MQTLYTRGVQPFWVAGHMNNFFKSRGQIIIDTRATILLSVGTRNLGIKIALSLHFNSSLPYFPTLQNMLFTHHWSKMPRPYLDLNTASLIAHPL